MDGLDLPQEILFEGVLWLDILPYTFYCIWVLSWLMHGIFTEDLSFGCNFLLFSSRGQTRSEALRLDAWIIIRFLQFKRNTVWNVFSWTLEANCLLLSLFCSSHGRSIPMYLPLLLWWRRSLLSREDIPWFWLCTCPLPVSFGTFRLLAWRPQKVKRLHPLGSLPKGWSPFGRASRSLGLAVCSSGFLPRKSWWGLLSHLPSALIRQQGRNCRIGGGQTWWPHPGCWGRRRWWPSDSWLFRHHRKSLLSSPRLREESRRQRGHRRCSPRRRTASNLGTGVPAAFRAPSAPETLLSSFFLLSFCPFRSDICDLVWSRYPGPLKFPCWILLALQQLCWEVWLLLRWLLLWRLFLLFFPFLIWVFPSLFLKFGVRFFRLLEPPICCLICIF